MFTFCQGDLGGIDNETLDFSQLEDYINDETEANNIYFPESLVSNDLKLTAEAVKEQLYSVPTNGPPSRTTGIVKVDGSSSLSLHLSNEPLSHSSVVVSSSSSPLVKSASFRTRNGPVGSSFCKPHLPDSPPDSGSEPPFSPPNEDPKMSCSTTSSIEMLHHQSHPHHHSHHNHHSHPMGDTTNGKGYLHHALHLQPLKHVHDVGLIQSSPSSPSPHSLHLHHHPHHNPSLPSVPIVAQSSHSTSLPLLSIASLNSTQTPLLNHLSQNVLGNSIPTNQQQSMMTPPNGHIEHIYTGGDELIYDNLTSPTPSTNYKKRKISNSPKPSRSCLADVVHVKTEPVVSSSPDPHGGTLLPSSDEDYNLDLSGTEGGSPFVDSNYQCIRFQPFQQNTWVQLLDKDMNEIAPPHFRVDADKGFNYSNADESFVCQKKNHFQVTIHLQNATLVQPHFLRSADGIKPIERFTLRFHGVKMESPTQTIKVEQSQSDRSKKPFRPVPVELLSDQVSKTTVGRLHFSETTSNNMRKKGKPNPDQRFFFLVVNLCAQVIGDPDSVFPVVVHSSEKIIVRASNPGQFENDMELSWQKGNTPDSIFHAGRVGINTDRPEESLVVHGNVKVTGHIVQPSDSRAKVDVQELDTREQLRNVTNLRIVRYRYLPEFATHVGVSQEPDTGVIAQEVQNVLPEAVIETGDIMLPNGQLVEKLLVVNKERIFMENVGAVKELCKVTDNLENRIDELEKINKKLTSIKRKDSLKSNATEVSRMGSVSSRERSRAARRYTKRGIRSSANSCSSRFVQSTIVALLVIMAFCLIALATLYIMEFQNRHWMTSYVLMPSVKTVKSTQSTNSSLLRPDATTASVTRTNYPPSLSVTTPSSRSTSKQKPSDKYISLPSPSPEPSFPQAGRESETVFGQLQGECPPAGLCPVFCCGALAEERSRESVLPFPESDDDIHTNTKRSGILSESAFKGQLTDVPMSLGESRRTLSVEEPSTEVIPKESSKTVTQIADYERNYMTVAHVERRNIRKRMIDSNEVQKLEQGKDDVLPHGLHLLELNLTLSLDMCKEERFSGSPSIRLTCHVSLSRHFSRVNITMRLSTEVPMLSDYCGSSGFLSCPVDSHGLAKTTPSAAQEVNSWLLPVGSHLSITHRFRFVPRSLFPDSHQLCNIQESIHPVTEYVIKFQRMCDK